MKFWILSLLIYITPAFSQTNVQFKESIFGDSITYQSSVGNSQTINIYTYNISKTPKHTVILMHGCGGLKEHSKIWIKQLTEWNYNVVVIDSFYWCYCYSHC
jgi:hypothetical protein